MKSNKIDYANWPENIKDDFKILIASTKDTRIMELKNIIDNEFSEFNCIIEKLLSFKEIIKDIPDIKNYEINTENMIMNVLGTVMAPIALCYHKGKTHIDSLKIEKIFFDAKSLTKNLFENFTIKSNCQFSNYNKKF